MTPFFDIEKIFEDFLKNSNLKGKWAVQQIDEPNIKGYIVQGRFTSDQPLDPFGPFEPLNPWQRRPMPQRPFRTAENTLNEIREPFVDLFEEKTAVKLYVELPGEEKDDIQLNVTDGEVEVKATKFYKVINVPGNIDVEKTSSKYNNGVLTVVIPKKEPSPQRNRRTVAVE